MTTVRLVCPGRWEVVCLVGPVFGNARGIAGRMRKQGMDATETDDGEVIVRCQTTGSEITT